MKGIVTSFRETAGFKTAQITGEFNGVKIVLGLSDANTTMMTYGKNIKEGSEVEIPDKAIKVSSEGRYYLDRISGDKFLEAAKMRQAQITFLKAEKDLSELIP